MAHHRHTTDVAGLRRGLAVPCFAEDPADLVRLGIGAEQAGLDGYFLWDHLVHSDSGNGPPIVDPWQVLAVVAARTSRIKLGTMITPVARRRPWKLAKEVTTLDLLSGGRVILGVGLGAPAHGEFRLFGEPPEPRVRAELLDEGLAILAGLCTGQLFSHEGKHFTVGPVRFSPSPVQRPRVPIWVGGILPAGGLIARTARWVAGRHPPSGPVTRAARWDGFVPIHPGRPGDRATVGEIAAARDKIASLRGNTADFDIAVWGELGSAGRVAARLPRLPRCGGYLVCWRAPEAPGPAGSDAVRERLHGRLVAREMCYLPDRGYAARDLDEWLLPTLLDVPDLDKWVVQWDQLVDSSPLPSPFLRSWWLTGTGGPGRHFLLVIDGAHLLGGLAVEQHHRMRSVRMMGDGPLCPDHLDLLAASGHEETVVSLLRDWFCRPGERLLGLQGHPGRVTG